MKKVKLVCGRETLLFNHFKFKKEKKAFKCLTKVESLCNKTKQKTVCNQYQNHGKARCVYCGFSLSSSGSKRVPRV